MSIDIINSEKYFQDRQKQNNNLQNDIDETVLEIIKQVQAQKDEAVQAYTAKLDRVTLDTFRISEQEIEEAKANVTEDFINAMLQAKENITAFHEEQREKSWFITKETGALLGQQITPMEKIGIYIPGGKAAYPSTVLMNVIPAQIAGVKEIVMTTPPQKDGKINPHVLVAAKIVGIKNIYKIGGAQAIAALAYGTETIPKVDKIVGPGNAYVARAKKWVFGDVDIDMIAGPSEICVVADDTAPISFVAADLLSQAEHDEDAMAVCITFSETMALEIRKEIDTQLKVLPRQTIAQKSIEKHGKIIVADNLQQAFDVVNDLAPEHLQLMFHNAKDYVSDIKHAGAIFTGNYSPEALGDYMAGPNHTLPTSGTAKFASPLGVYDFVKKSSVIHYTRKALLQEADYIREIATTEGLDGHANAIHLRTVDDQ